MLIQPDPELRKQVIDAIAKEYNIGSGRPGLHQSELIYCLTKSYWARTDPEPPTEKEVLLFSVGFMMERVIFKETPEPIELDSITVSLDSIVPFGPIDLKTTRRWAKGRKDEDGFQWPESWKKAFAAYRYVLNHMCICGHAAAYHKDDWCTHPGLPTCYCRGGFTRPEPSYTFGAVVLHLMEPEMSAWTITYTPEELEAHWEYLLERRDQFHLMLVNDDPQPFVHNEAWECRDCTYLMRCQLQGSLDQLEGKSGT